MDAYLYVPASEKDQSLACGIKLSVKGEKAVLINGHPTQCISALLNPRDDAEKFKDSSFSCLRIDINPENCYIADKSLYGVSELAELYSKSIVSPDNYTFGTYRNPECLIPRTILPDNLSMANKPIGFPLLYEDSEKLYVSNLIESFREKYPDFEETILSLFIELNQKDWNLKKTKNNEFYILSHEEKGVYYTIRT